MKYFHPIKPITRTVPGELWEDPSYIAEEKVRGIQTVIKINKEGRARFYSRKGKEQTSRLQRNLKKFPDEFKDSIIVGELYHPGPEKKLYGDESFMTGLLNSKPYKAKQLRREYGDVQLKLLDIYHHRGINLIDQKTPYSFRKKILEKAPFELPRARQKNKLKFFQDISLQGAEGVVLKNLAAPYNKLIYKIKTKQRYSYKVLGIDPSTTRPWAASIIYGEKNNPIGKVNIPTEKLRREFFQKPEKIIGKKIIIEAEGVGSKGALLKPVFVKLI